MGALGARALPTIWLDIRSFKSVRFKDPSFVARDQHSALAVCPLNSFDVPTPMIILTPLVQVIVS